MQQIAGRSFSIAYGTAPDGADSIALNFSDGRTQVLPVEHGTWMYIEPETVSELSTVEALHGTGSRIDRINVPRLPEPDASAREEP